MAAYDWRDIMCAILLLAGVGEACGPGEGACLRSGQATTDHQNLVSFMPGCLWLVGCYVYHLAIGWRGWGRWSLSAVRAGYHRSSKLVSFMHGCLWLVGCYVRHLAIGCCGRDRFKNHCESLNACLWLVGFMAGEGGPDLGISASDLDPYQERGSNKAWKGSVRIFKTSLAIGWHYRRSDPRGAWFLVNWGLLVPFYCTYVPFTDSDKMCAKFVC